MHTEKSLRNHLLLNRGDRPVANYLLLFKTNVQFLPCNLKIKYVGNIDNICFLVIFKNDVLITNIFFERKRQSLQKASPFQAA